MELVRIARTLDARLVASRTAPGRGAWLCVDQPECLRAADRRNAFDRALRAPVPAGAAADLAAGLFGAKSKNLRDLSVAGPWPDGRTRTTKG